MVDIFLCNLHHFKPHCPMGFIPFFNKFEYDLHTVKCTDHNRGSLPPSPIFSKPHPGQPWPPALGIYSFPPSRLPCCTPSATSPELGSGCTNPLCPSGPSHSLHLRLSRGSRPLLPPTYLSRKSPFSLSFCISSFRKAIPLFFSYPL